MMKINHIFVIFLTTPGNFAYGRKIEKVGTQKERKKVLLGLLLTEMFCGISFQVLNLCGHVFTKMELFYHIML